jgi:hypothetical protein
MSRTLHRAWLVTVLAVALALIAVAPAMAAPVQPGAFDVEIWPQRGENVSGITVYAVLPGNVALPATVRLPLPEGATVMWSGEILGTTTSADIQRKATVVDVPGGKAVEFTIETTRAAQYEAAWGKPEVKGGGVSTQTFLWKQTTAPARVGIAVRFNPGVGNVTIKPAPSGPPATNTNGESLYTLGEKQFATGQGEQVVVGWTPGAATGGTATGATVPGSTSGTSPVLTFVLVGVGVVVVGFVILALTRRKGSEEGSDDADDDDSAEGDPEDTFGTEEPAAAAAASDEEPGSDDDDTDVEADADPEDTTD